MIKTPDGILIPDRDEVTRSLEHADKLAPPNHPSGKDVLFVLEADDDETRTQIALETASALGILAAEVRRLPPTDAMGVQLAIMNMLRPLPPDVRAGIVGFVLLTQFRHASVDDVLKVVREVLK